MVCAAICGKEEGVELQCVCAYLRVLLLQVLQMIPENHHVGLITFGTHVHVHELGYAECSKAFVFRGSKEYTSSQVGQWAIRASNGHLSGRV